jgi:hypothetical protein
MGGAAQSIKALLPLDLSGRYSRQGFDYQDHVGVYLCLCMIVGGSIREVWFETQDDITLLHNEDGKDSVEFVQVKNEDRTSRWSVSAVCQSKNGNGSCLVTKSLNNDRCIESTRFRIVTSYDVTNDLDVLKYPIAGTFRTASKDKEEELIAEIEKIIGKVQSPNGNGIDYWARNCTWEKLPDSIEALEAKNKLMLEKALKMFPHNIFPDQRDELYQHLLGLIKYASTVDVFHDISLSKIEKQQLLEWLSNKVTDFGKPKGGTERLRKKLTEGDIDYVIIENAEALKWQYLQAKLRLDFVRAKDYSILERKVAEILLDLKLQLDTGQLNLSAVSFLQLCKHKIEEYVTTSAIEIPRDEAVGFMFDHTNRCLHRFIRP